MSSTPLPMAPKRADKVVADARADERPEVGRGIGGGTW